MKQTKQIMGMPITVEIVDDDAMQENVDAVFSYFESIDERFSTYKPESEISKINRGEIRKPEYSAEMREVLELCEETKNATDGYFDITTSEGLLDPSGLVKGWAIHNAALLLEKNNCENFYIEAGGDIQVHGNNTEGGPWRIGIKNPLQANEIIKVLFLTTEGVATSGTYERGLHIYNPHNRQSSAVHDIISLTVVGKNIYEADRFATAAFAMGKKGIEFIERTEGLEGYVIDKDGIGTETSGFKKYLTNDKN
jgi:thiamine biosynthesis lipoprotein